MNRPSIYSILGCLAIAVTAVSYSTFIVQAPFNSLTIALTGIALVCILLGMTLLVTGYELQNLQRLILGEVSIRDSLLESNLPGENATSNLAIKIPRPNDFPPMARAVPAELIGAEMHQTALDEPARSVVSPSEVVEVTESEKRLEHLRAALHRAGSPREVSPESPHGLAAEPERKMSRPRVRTIKAPASEVRATGLDGMSFHVALVGKDEIVLSSTSTGEEVKFSCEDPETLETAWRAFAKGEKVRPIIESGRITRIDVA